MEANNIFIDGLNPVQKESVLYCDGPSLVIAGAGSGKTKVLTHKIAYLISKGIKPYRIMALTFTNKASAEMKQRVDMLLGGSFSHDLFIGTFHSVFGRILRAEAEKIGFTSNFTIYDTADSLNLVKQIIKDMNLTDENYKPKVIFNRISACKNRLITAGAYAGNDTYRGDDAKAKRPQFSSIYEKYVAKCKVSNVMDFDDLLLYTNILFKINEEVLGKYRSRFDYILVDEYQDTNYAQYLIVKRLSEIHRKLFVVGDDAQSIYSFRGAEIRNILNFKNDYPDYKLFKLEQNYRSTQNIVDAANSLIRRNTEQIPKTVFSKKEKGDKIFVRTAPSDSVEGKLVALKISELHNSEDIQFSDIAILYRTNAQSRILEEYLRAENIPYKVFGGLSFYQRKEIKDIIAYIRFTINYEDVEAFKRIVNYPSRKIGQATIDKILTYSETEKISIWNLITNIQQFPIQVNVQTKLKLLGFAKLIAGYSDKINTLTAYEYIVDLVNASGINLELMADKTVEGVARYENIQELLNGVKLFSDSRLEAGEPNGILEYLESVSILTDLEEPDENNKDKVSLMTIHTAKGLEFSDVFIVGAEENLFPGAMSILDPKELEEERRLFYVAITRAKKRLFIYHAENRFRFGNISPMHPSRFLKDIDICYIDSDEDLTKKSANFYDHFEQKQYTPSYQSERPAAVSTAAPRNLKSISEMNRSNNEVADISAYSVGIRVKHKVFGEGAIMSIAGTGGDAKVVVFFDTGDTKTLLLKFAKLQILN